MSLSCDRERSYIVEQNLKRKDQTISDGTMVFARKTDDLEKFRWMGGNREIRPSWVNELKKSIMKNGYLKSQPIVVNEYYEVVDGQHRLEACRQLGCPIYYTVEIGATLKDCQALNQGAKRWKMDDYILSYAVDHPDYARLIDIYNPKSSWGFNLILMICRFAGARGWGNEQIKTGRLVLSEFTADRAKWVYDFIDEHTEDIQNIKGRRDKFAEAIAFSLLNTDCAADRMGKLLRERLYLVGVIGDVDTAIAAVEKLYNYRLRNGFVDICGIWKNWKYYSKRAK